MPFSLIPREEKFYDLFEKHAQTLVLGARELKSLMDDWQGVDGKVERIREYEHACDSITHQIFEALHRTFVTPIDREDIGAIAERLDDIMDYIDEAALTMQTYKIIAPTQRAIEMAGVIEKATVHVHSAISILRNHGRLRDILPLAVEINALENEADLIYRNALAELFDDSREDVVEIIKWRDIYEHLEQAIDRCEDVANVLEGIVIKNA
ncbi:MAG: phosphate transport regulator [Dehalococcoidia bacterium]|nr:phosphate transport regulator [Dehalococcoidia bacterium]